jgi:thiol-disulfide isomerase/thioredoxin
MSFKHYSKLIIIVHYVTNFAISKPIKPSGIYYCNIKCNDSISVDFQMNFDTINNTLKIINGKEEYPANNWNIQNDTLYLKPHHFNTLIKAHISSKSNNIAFAGQYFDYARKEAYSLPFYATSTKPQTPKYTQEAALKYKYEITFDDGTTQSKAVGIFETRENKVNGTILTTSGDYRYLNGSIVNNILSLQTFDGVHVFYFCSTIQNAQLINGHFFSGSHHHENFWATANDNAKLPSNDFFKYLNDSSKSLNFAFPNALNDTISINSTEYKNKAVLLQLSGSWCPNCMDQTQFLVEHFNTIKDKEIEVVKVNFERKSNWNYVKEILEKEKSNYKLPFQILFGGTLSNSGKSIENLSKIPAYPTLLFIDKNRKVKHIEIGIDGPATGEYYEKWKANFWNKLKLIEK